MKWETNRRKRNNVDVADASGEVADSLAVRHAILARIKSGEITLAEGQAELESIKRNAAKHGLKTRDQVWRES
jgi:hypothetical protein